MTGGENTISRSNLLHCVWWTIFWEGRPFCLVPAPGTSSPTWTPTWFLPATAASSRLHNRLTASWQISISYLCWSRCRCVGGQPWESDRPDAAAHSITIFQPSCLHCWHRVRWPRRAPVSRGPFLALLSWKPHREPCRRCKSGAARKYAGHSCAPDCHSLLLKCYFLDLPRLSKQLPQEW